jgi:DNA-directed RNA polymerase specialized sigma24 family protein
VRVYLDKVAESVVVDSLRAASAAKRGRARLTNLPDEAGSFADRLADPGVSPEERLLANELRRHFLQRCRAVAGRRSKDRSVRIVRLAVLEGWSSREISERFRLAPTGVDSLVHRMRHRLAQEGLHLQRR